MNDPIPRWMTEKQSADAIGHSPEKPGMGPCPAPIFVLVKECTLRFGIAASSITRLTFQSLPGIDFVNSLNLYSSANCCNHSNLARWKTA
ncbi:MAG: hypothetical protein AAFZ15_11270 [Bacteroidota bacterium]